VLLVMGLPLSAAVTGRTEPPAVLIATDTGRNLDLFVSRPLFSDCVQEKGSGPAASLSNEAWLRMQQRVEFDVGELSAA